MSTVQSRLGQARDGGGQAPASHSPAATRDLVRVGVGWGVGVRVGVGEG